MFNLYGITDNYDRVKELLRAMKDRELMTRFHAILRMDENELIEDIPAYIVISMIENILYSRQIYYEDGTFRQP